MLEKVSLEHSSKSTKYELEGSYDDLVHEHFSFLKTAKLPRECNEEVVREPLGTSRGAWGGPPAPRNSKSKNSNFQK